MPSTARRWQPSQAARDAYREQSLWTMLLVCALFSPGLRAENWKPALGLGGSLRLTDNVFLAPAGRESADLITTVTPAIGLKGSGSRLTLDFSYAPTVITYVRNAQSDQIRNNLSAFAKLEAVDDYLFFEARASVYQAFINPFGPRPDNLTSVTPNRQDFTTVGFSPYIRHRNSSGSEYGLRNDSVFTTSRSSAAPNNFTNRFTANYAGAPGTAIVPSADYANTYVQFEGSPATFLQIARGRLTAPFDPQTSVFVIGGYERNDLVFGGYEGPIYGGGAKWSPSPRTDVALQAEKRFFGLEYSARFSHRTRMTSWNLSASNGLQTFTSSPLRLSTFDTRDLVDSRLRSTIPDPVARAQAVEQFMRESGLPESTLAPTNFYTTRVNEVQNVNASVGILGVRNSLIFSLFYRETTPVNTASSSGQPDIFNTFAKIDQRGGNVSFSHKVSALLSAGAGLDRIYTVGSGVGTVGGVPATQNSKQTTFNVNMTRQFGPKTFGSVAARFFVLDQVGGPNDITERSFLVSLTHTFY